MLLYEAYIITSCSSLMCLASYPAVYIIAVAPMAIVRWMAFSGYIVPSAATLIASILFSFSGLFNVILYASTRPKLMPTRGPGIHAFGGNNACASPIVPAPMSFALRTSISPIDHSINNYGNEAWKASSEHSTMGVSKSIQAHIKSSRSETPGMFFPPLCSLYWYCITD